MTPETARDVQDERKGWMDPLDVRDYLDDAVATIAAQTWEYGVEVDDEPHSGTRFTVWPWDCTELDAKEYMASYPPLEGRNPRLVRRMVGPVEEVE